MKKHESWHKPREFPLPAYFKHPKTGVMVEVDTEGITTFSGSGSGHFRAYERMRLPGISGVVWGPAAEILTLVNHGWRRA